MRAVWKPLIVDRAWNAEIRDAAKDASGAYVIRRKSDGVVLYVGMSEAGHLWRTMTRHFHDWKSLPKHFWSADGTRLVRGGESFQHARPELLEAALFVTSVRKRTKHTPDRLARNLEADLISRYAPVVNLDPGHAWDDRDATRALRRRGKHGASPASSEPVPEAEPENDAAEPEAYEDTSDDPEDPFAVRNPAMPKKKTSPRTKLTRAELAEDRALGKRLASGLAAEEREAMKAIRAEEKTVAAAAKKFPAGARVVFVKTTPLVWAGTVATIGRWGELVLDSATTDYGAPLSFLDARALEGLRAARAGEATPEDRRGAPPHQAVEDGQPYGMAGRMLGFAKNAASVPSIAAERGADAERFTRRAIEALAELGEPPDSYSMRKLGEQLAEAEAIQAAARPASRPEGYGAEEKGKKGGQLRMFNPSKRRNPAPQAPRTAMAASPDGFLVELGRLTALEVRSRVGNTVSSSKWSPRSAPILAYDLRGRLFIVYVDNVTTRAARSSETSRYKRTHWGQEGRGALVGGAILTGSCKVWGVGTRITYTTKKGDDRELVDYVHDWGEGATSAWEPPLVVAHGTRFALAGGTYRVDTRGIVG